MVTGHFTTPPPKGIIYAPMMIAQAIAQGMSERGHKVYFFAPKGSKVKGVKIIDDGIEPLKGVSGKKNPKILTGPYVGGIEINKIFNLYDQYFVGLAYRFAIENKIDILHIHPIDRALPFGLAFREIPTVYTLHDPIYPWRAGIFRMFKTNNQFLVSISNAQRKPAEDLNYIATVYNGLNLKLFPYNEKPNDRLLFVGRLLETKGVDIAIQAAIKAKEKLDIVGLPAKGEFWDKKIKPFLSKDIRYLGGVKYEETYKFYQQAKAVLCPIKWEEPFGLTFIEAMATGSPVVTFDRGSAKEVIKNGETGFVVKPFKKGKINIDGFVEAIKKIGTIKRKKCRQRVEKNFSTEKMVEDYEKVFYRAVLKTGKR